MYCEDYPCCGHTYEDPCDYREASGEDMLADPARYHIGCDHAAGWCDYEDDFEDDLDDAEADGMTLASIGWGTDEDYGYYGE